MISVSGSDGFLLADHREEDERGRGGGEDDDDEGRAMPELLWLLFPSHRVTIGKQKAIEIVQS